MAANDSYWIVSSTEPDVLDLYMDGVLIARVTSG
jgi:hypothetical protein